MARRLLALLILGLAIAVVWASIAHFLRRPTITQTIAVAIRPPGAPYRSARLLAGSPWAAAERERFASEMQTIINAGDMPAKTGVIFLDPRGGPPLYAHNQDMPLVPASTIKLIVAGAALRDLGSDFRFTTTVNASAPVSGDAITGDVWLVGSGDPELSTHDLREAAQMLKRAGVRIVTGSVYADGSAFGPDAIETTWSAEDLLYGWAAPASAVSIDNGAIEFTVTPTESGSAARIDALPPGAIDRLSGSITTAPYDTSLRIDPGPGPQQYTVSGHIAQGVPQKFWRSLQDPTSRAARIFRTILLQAGIEVGGAWSVRPAPPDARILWSHRSRPLADIIRHMTFDSDNHIAEQLLRALGHAAYAAGTPSNGLLAERTYLERLGADDARLALVDGSGLSPDNRVSAGVLGAALRSIASNPDADRMIALLPRVAVEGTVRFRSLAPDAKGRVFGKSGYIEGATGLAGFVKTRNHGVIIYALLSNDWTSSLDAVWAAQSRALATAARW